jgi:hypothetical protein
MTHIVFSRLSIVAAALLFAATQPVNAIHPLGGYCKKTCPPFNCPCFGYQQTQWRPWPTACADAHAPEHTELPILPKPQSSPEIKDRKKDEAIPAKKEPSPAMPVPKTKPDSLPAKPEKNPEESRSYPQPPSIFAMPQSRH